MKESRRMRNVGIALTIANACNQGYDIDITEDMKTTYEGALEFLRFEKLKLESTKKIILDGITPSSPPQ